MRESNACVPEQWVVNDTHSPFKRPWKRKDQPYFEVIDNKTTKSYAHIYEILNAIRICGLNKY